ncbi:hypothetical protein BSFP_028740 [Burkholderia stabilis]|uniref:Uncharacterized protein n=1 Tax=Burkholderia stabilis TaxID=95485 RepID=A0A1Y1BP18_9BURK|nr:hypothetical protein BSFP_028740 [Burkholderia stabilis]
MEIFFGVVDMLAVVLKVGLLDPRRTFNERSAIMVDQKQGATSKDEKAGKPVAADQKQATPMTGSPGNDTAA